MVLSGSQTLARLKLALGWVPMLCPSVCVRVHLVLLYTAAPETTACPAGLTQLTVACLGVSLSEVFQRESVGCGPAWGWAGGVGAAGLPV